MGQRILALLVAVAALAGLGFAAVSTSDFVAHLDRQVHGIHCSFLPGMDAPDVSGSSGCHVTLMSPYSSVMRTSVWGGIPISLPAVPLFAYLAFFALALVVLRRTEDPRATALLALGAVVPFLTSVVMGWISLHDLGAACKLCIGIYTSSTLAFALSVTLALRARSAPVPAFEPVAEPDDGADQTVQDDPARGFGSMDTLDASGEHGIRRLATASEMDQRLAATSPRTSRPAPLGWGLLAGAAAAGIACVLLPVLAYAAGAPDFERYLGACGTLSHPDDPGHVLVPLGPQSRAHGMIEVLDPLCPACRGFEERFSGLEVSAQLSRRALLFPLDDRCNWMVDHAIHAGACAVSEAVLCARDDADEVLAWAFAEQEAIRTAAEHDPEAAARMARERFPSLASCIGSPEARARLNRALRWAVSNQLPVLTPQVYVDGTRICDADTDLGLDWTLERLVERGGQR